MNFAESLAEERKTLEFELADVAPKQKRLAAIIELQKLYGENGQTVMPEVFNGTGRFSRMKLTEAMMTMVKENPENFYTPREIGIAIESEGFKSASPNFTTTIYTTCRRKAKSGELVMGKKKGFKAFKFNAMP